MISRILARAGCLRIGSLPESPGEHENKRKESDAGVGGVTSLEMPGGFIRHMSALAGTTEHRLLFINLDKESMD